MYAKYKNNILICSYSFLSSVTFINNFSIIVDRFGASSPTAISNFKAFASTSPISTPPS